MSAVSPVSPAREPRMTAPAPPGRTLVVGAGGISRQMLRALADAPWHQVAGVVDPRGETRENVGRDAGLPDDARFADLETALAAVRSGKAAADAAFVSTPSEMHYGQSLACLEAGLDVLVAKPVTNSWEEATALVRAAERAGRRLAVGQQLRYNRHYRGLADFVASGALGEVEAVSFQNCKYRPDVGNLAPLAQPALYEMACHHFDSLIAVLPADARPERVACDAYRPSWSVYGGPCMVHALLSFSRAGGAAPVHVTYVGGFSSQAEWYELRLEGTRGALRCRGSHMSAPDFSYEFAGRGGRFGPVEVEQGEKPADPIGDPWRRYFDAWREWRAGGPEPPFSGRRNLVPFALLCAARDSAEAGGAPVAVAPGGRYAEAFR